MLKLEELDREAFLKEFDSEVRSRLVEQMDNQGTTALVAFENLDMCSSQFGARACMPVGPGWTTFKRLSVITDAEGMGPRLGDVPSRFQYAQKVWRKPQPSLERCGKCPMCLELDKFKHMYMPNPPHTHATDKDVKDWNTNVLAHPCDTWSPEQLEVFIESFSNMSVAIRPDAQVREDWRRNRGMGVQLGEKT